MEYLGWLITPDPTEQDMVLCKFQVEEIMRDLNGYFWPGHVKRWCGYKITFIEGDE